MTAIFETIRFRFENSEQQRAFHGVLSGNDHLTTDYGVIADARTQAIDDCIKVVRERAAEHLRQAAEFDASDDFMAADADHCRELAKDLFVIASHLEALKGKTEKKWPGELKDDPSSARD